MSESLTRNQSPTADLFYNYVNICGISHREVAEKAGYKRQNIVTMFKSGDCKIPIEKIPILSKLLGVDPARFMRTALAEYMPTAFEAIEETLGTSLTANETEIVKKLRELTQDRDPKLQNTNQLNALAAFAESLVGTARKTAA